MNRLTDALGTVLAAGDASIRTRFTPPLPLRVGQGSGEGLSRELVGRLLKPEVVLAGAIYAPYGRPGDEWALWLGALVLLAVVGVVAIVRAVR